MRTMRTPRCQGESTTSAKWKPKGVAAVSAPIWGRYRLEGDQALCMRSCLMLYGHMSRFRSRDPRVTAWWPLGSCEMQRSQPGGLEPIMRALRFCGDEVQLTRSIHAFADDETFASSFANLLLDVARRARGPASVAAAAVPALGGRVRCIRERMVGRGEDARGRCDLWFEADGPPAVTLAVEVKLYAGYQTRQRERYINELRRRTTGAGGLIVITNRPHPSPTGRLLADPLWLGEVTWEALYEANLVQVAFSEPGGVRQQAWQALVEVLRADGDLGPIANVDPIEIARWVARLPESTKKPLVDLLEAVADDAQHVLGRIATERGLKAVGVPGTQSGWRVYGRGRDYVLLSWKLAGGRGLTVELVLCRNEQQSGTILEMQTWIRPRPGRILFPDARAAARRKFKTHSAWPGWWMRSSDINLNASSSHIRETVVAEWRSALRALDAAGTFSSHRES